MVELYQDLTKPAFKKNTYLAAYEELFKNISNPLLIEVGVLGGGSLELWKNYFGSGAKIVGIDLNPEAKKTAPTGVRVFTMDQNLSDEWETFWKQLGKADILIDDGGHLDNQQITTVLQALPNMVDEGLIIVEDTDFSYRAELKNPSKKSFISFVFSSIDAINSRDLHVNIRLTEEQTLIAKYVQNIQIFTTMVVFTINEKKCAQTVPIIVNARGEALPEDFRLHGSTSSIIRNLQTRVRRNIVYRRFSKFIVIGLIRKIWLAFVSKFVRW